MTLDTSPSLILKIAFDNSCNTWLLLTLSKSLKIILFSETKFIIWSFEKPEILFLNFSASSFNLKLNCLKLLFSGVVKRSLLLLK